MEFFRMPPLVLALWRYRQFIISAISSEFRLRFARSYFGALWGIFNPLAQVAIYAIILSNVLQSRMSGLDHPYSFAIYLTAGLVCWNLFNEVITRCLNIFVVHGNLIKKSTFPKVVLPAIVVGGCLLDNIVLIACMLGMFVVLGHDLSIYILWLPFVLLITMGVALGIGLILGVLNVFIRDVAQVTPICLQILFWFTPIVYPKSILPEEYQAYLMLNPLFPLVSAYQDLLVFGVSPDVTALAWALPVAAGLLGISLFLYLRASEEMADVL